ncbi:MAG TPA: hypothetical protein VFK24_05180 [Gammaproteobacteria bacterium]|nr:hypothetical protein [Gammaproteobacteria bacterium]
MEQMILRTKMTPYIVMTILLGPFPVAFLIIGILRGDWKGATPVLGLFAILLLCYAYFSSFKVILADDRLSVRNLYIWHHIRLSEIKRAFIQTSMKTWLGDEAMTFRIWIEPYKQTGKKGFFVPIVNFKPDELHELYQVLGIKSKRTRLFSREKTG